MNKSTEVWVDVPGFEGAYQVSNTGMVRSLDRKVNGRFGSSAIKKGKVLKASPNKEGYYSVSLSKKSKCTMFYIHRLLAVSFIPNLEHKREVNHINGNKQDNRLENLEWVSSSENRKHAWDTGLKFATQKMRDNMFILGKKRSKNSIDQDLLSLKEK